MGDAEVSEKHAGFIINKGQATSAEIAELIRYVQDVVFKEYGVMLEPEVMILPPDYHLDDNGPAVPRNRVFPAMGPEAVSEPD